MDTGISELESAIGYFDLSVYGDSLAEEEKTEIARQAVLLGEKRAAEIQKEFGTHIVTELIRSQGIRITETFDKNGWDGRFVKFAEYYGKTKEIHLNREALEVLGRVMEEKTAREIVLCHELYHHFECTRWGPTADLFIRRIKIFRCIPAKRKMLPAAEIAADSFTKQFLSLEYSPKMIEEYYFKEKEKSPR